MIMVRLELAGTAGSQAIKLYLGLCNTSKASQPEVNYLHAIQNM